MCVSEYVCVNLFLCVHVGVFIHVPEHSLLTLLTFISLGNASSHLSFIHSAICDQGSFSGTDACQKRPCPMVCCMLQSEQTDL